MAVPLRHSSKWFSALAYRVNASSNIIASGVRRSILIACPFFDLFFRSDMTSPPLPQRDRPSGILDSLPVNCQTARPE